MRAALIQMRGDRARDENLDRAEELLKEAARAGAEVACLQELFATWFFAQTLDPAAQALAEPLDGPTVTRMRAVARALSLVLVVPFYEKVQPGELYNIGIMICYDRHFPEAARMLALHGAEVIFVPTATTRRGYSSSVWELELRGHAVANGFFVAGVNRVGTERDSTYYGRSVIVDPIGQIVAQAGETDEEVLVADLDLARVADVRRAWPFFRDRRPDAYGDVAAR